LKKKKIINNKKCKFINLINESERPIFSKNERIINKTGECLVLSLSKFSKVSKKFVENFKIISLCEI
jgi:hypothetical protein